MVLKLLGLVCLGCVAGCATAVVAPGRSNTVIVVPGLGGDGFPYGQVVHSLETHGSGDCLCVSDWGSSWPIFLISLESADWHRNAEAELADRISRWHRVHPGSRIVVIAHSAGAGVAMGALAKLERGIVVGPVVLLAPDLSPDFDLRPALRHAGVIHVFYSRRDDFFLGLGTTIAGTYDHAHCEAAGRDGFTLAGLSPFEKARVIQHVYEDDWLSLGNGGGHFDWLAEEFVAAVIEPIIDGERGRLFAGNWK
jgi:hypothetical protein